MKILDTFKLTFRVETTGAVKLIKSSKRCGLSDADGELMENLLRYLLEEKIDTGEDRFVGNSDDHIHEPGYALHLSLSDYSVGTKTPRHGETIRCPKCGKLSDTRHHHGDTYQCGSCKIYLTTYGNSLWVYYK